MIGDTKNQLRVCILDGWRGIKLPQDFVKCIDRELWEGISEENYTILNDGPDNALYWEAWDEVLADAFTIDENGVKWILTQDNDLFIIPAPNYSRNPDCIVEDRTVYIRHENASCYYECSAGTGDYTESQLIDGNLCIVSINTELPYVGCEILDDDGTVLSEFFVQEWEVYPAFPEFDDMHNGDIVSAAIEMCFELMA